MLESSVTSLRRGFKTRQIPESCSIIIFGATGDLTHRKLIPALYNLALNNELPKSLRVIENRDNEVNDIFTDPKRIRKTILKVDPARIVPAKIGEPIMGVVTRDNLRQLAKRYTEDIIFIFRRTWDDAKNKIHHQGILYLARQKKVLALKEIMNSGSESIQKMDSTGLKALAQEARKVLHSHKFEKRQSAY